MSGNRRSLAKLLGDALEAIPDPSRGLPGPAFAFALRVMPMINVDLLVRNAAGEHLLAWREDEYDSGWHVPGGIIRLNEPIEKRIAAVAQSELGCAVRYDPFPSDIKEFFTRRGHFVSLMYLCTPGVEPARGSAFASDPRRPRHGELAWHRGVPPDLYRAHLVYSDWLNGRARRAATA